MPGGAALSARRRSGAASLPASKGSPDVHYGDDEHFVSGNRGASEWTISGTTTEGERIEVRGCDLWTFDEDGKPTRKGFVLEDSRAGLEVDHRQV
jgi:SnoaL-like protein